MSKGIRLLTVATAAVVAVVVIVLSSGKQQETSQPVQTLSAPPCQKAPAKIAMPVWIPKDLPLPPGAYAVRAIGDSPSGGHTGVFVIRLALRPFVQYVFGEWRDKRGWELGRGDSEPSEVESVFRDGHGRVGAFRARTSLFCDANLSELLLYVGRENTG